MVFNCSFTIILCISYLTSNSSPETIQFQFDFCAIFLLGAMKNLFNFGHLKYLIFARNYSIFEGFRIFEKFRKFQLLLWVDSLINYLTSFEILKFQWFFLCIFLFHFYFSVLLFSRNFLQFSLFDSRNLSDILIFPISSEISDP